MERIETVDAWMVRWVVMMVRVARGCGHAHEALQITVGVRVWTHAGRGDRVSPQDTART